MIDVFTLLEFRGKKYPIHELEDEAVETCDKKTQREIVQIIAEADPLEAERLKDIIHLTLEIRKSQVSMLKKKKAAFNSTKLKKGEKE